MRVWAVVLMTVMNAEPLVLAPHAALPAIGGAVDGESQSRSCRPQCKRRRLRQLPVRRRRRRTLENYSRHRIHRCTLSRQATAVPPTVVLISVRKAFPAALVCPAVICVPFCGKFVEMRFTRDERVSGSVDSDPESLVKGIPAEVARICKLCGACGGRRKLCDESSAAGCQCSARRTGLSLIRARNACLPENQANP